MRKKLLLLSLSLSLALFAVLWFTFAPSYVINSGLTTQRKILENNQQFIFYSLDPSSIYSTEIDGAAENSKPKFEVPAKEKFHGYDVLGKTQINDSDVKAKLIKALESGIDEGGSAGIMCFDPRHGIRVVRGDQTVDLLICFECQRIDVFTNKSSGRAYTSGSPQKVFDSVLMSAKVPLGKRPNNN
jgi:hypothetical protein